jgi:hypothetical protein
MDFTDETKDPNLIELENDSVISHNGTGSLDDVDAQDINLSIAVTWQKSNGRVVTTMIDGMEDVYSMKNYYQKAVLKKWYGNVEVLRKCYLDNRDELWKHLLTLFAGHPYLRVLQEHCGGGGGCDGHLGGAGQAYTLESWIDDMSNIPYMFIQKYVELVTGEGSSSSRPNNVNELEVREEVESKCCYCFDCYDVLKIVEQVIWYLHPRGVHQLRSSLGAAVFNGWNYNKERNSVWKYKSLLFIHRRLLKLIERLQEKMNIMLRQKRESLDCSITHVKQAMVHALMVDTNVPKVITLYTQYCSYMQALNQTKEHENELWKVKEDVVNLTIASDWLVDSCRLETLTAEVKAKIKKHVAEQVCSNIVSYMKEIVDWYNETIINVTTTTTTISTTSMSTHACLGKCVGHVSLLDRFSTIEKEFKLQGRTDIYNAVIEWWLE